jgi:hypothetical protein
MSVTAEKRKVGSSTLPLTTDTLSPAETLILGPWEPGSPAGTEENYERERSLDQAISDLQAAAHALFITANVACQEQDPAKMRLDWYPMLAVQLSGQ